jgi:hypothetical protein
MSLRARQLHSVKRQFSGRHSFEEQDHEDQQNSDVVGLWRPNRSPIAKRFEIIIF